MAELAAVIGDQNTHTGGNLTVFQSFVFIRGKNATIIGNTAIADQLHNPPSTYAETGSGKVFIGGIAMHRHGDRRVCNATTVVTNQSKVYSG